jgi:hypothetical protein
MEISLEGIVRDIVVIGYMFVVRLGVPMVILFGLGWYLQRQLAERDAREAASEKEPKVARPDAERARPSELR